MKKQHDKPPMYREDFDGQGCGVPNCAHKHIPTSQKALFIHSVCHMNSNIVEAYYLDGDLFFICSICKKLAARIAVASKPADRTTTKII